MASTPGEASGGAEPAGLRRVRHRRSRSWELFAVAADLKGVRPFPAGCRATGPRTPDPGPRTPAEPCAPGPAPFGGRTVRQGGARISARA
ncbi:hypothetical protein GCM10010324_36280 [Streptomyces hiroshimensis]|uniref:Uncharacterized protein n=1 Tax=Streptomyces hiroshimensis TaxID=66424 RepID=A0ABQ2YMT9_9ACTN|nr:hypothetical protein GCM10010324_36280 [Streptomyces hiroshimensis]